MVDREIPSRPCALSGTIRRRAFVCLVAALLFAIASCGSGDAPSGTAEDGMAPEGGSSGRAPGAESTEGGASDGAVPGIDTVVVRMDEYVFDVPSTVPAGKVVFEVRNEGFEEHNFELHQGQLTLFDFERPLNPGAVRHLEADLEPGDYDVLCTVSGHEGRGMREVLTVEP